jgi:hypothetical protein
MKWQAKTGHGRHASRLFVFFTLEQRVLEDVAQSQYTL